MAMEPYFADSSCPWGTVARKNTVALGAFGDSMNRVSVPPKMLRWACERAGRDVAELAERFPKLPDWLAGDKQPTMNQLQELAKATRTPFGYFFLSKPPEETLSVADFRAVTTANRRRPSPDLLETIYTMQSRQAWLREYLIENHADPLA